jgi:hypothetical protein
MDVWLFCKTILVLSKYTHHVLSWKMTVVFPGLNTELLCMGRLLVVLLQSRPLKPLLQPWVDRQSSLGERIWKNLRSSLVSSSWLFRSWHLCKTIQPCCCRLALSGLHGLSSIWPDENNEANFNLEQRVVVLLLFWVSYNPSLHALTPRPPSAFAACKIHYNFFAQWKCQSVVRMYSLYTICSCEILCSSRYPSFCQHALSFNLPPIRVFCKQCLDQTWGSLSTSLDMTCLGNTKFFVLSKWHSIFDHVRYSSWKHHILWRFLQNSSMA